MAGKGPSGGGGGGGGSRAQTNKAHKSRFAAKSQRTRHKTARPGPPAGHCRISFEATCSEAHFRSEAADGLSVTPSLLLTAAAAAVATPQVLVGLSASGDVGHVRAQLLAACRDGATEEAACDGMDGVEGGAPAHDEPAGMATVAVPNHKLRLTVLAPPRHDLAACLQAFKIADVLAWVVPAAGGDGGASGGDGPGGNGDPGAAARSRLLLSVARAQGLPSVVGIVQGLVDVLPKRRADARRLATNLLHGQFPGCRAFPVDTANDCQQLLRHLAEARPAAPAWRAARPYVIAHEIAYEAGTLLLSGYVRSRGLDVNGLVHISGYGSYQLSQIDGPEDPCPLHGGRKATVIADRMDSSFAGSAEVLAEADPVLQERVVVEHDPDPLAGEQTWPTEEEMQDAVEEWRSASLKQRRVPKGTSSYQASRQASRHPAQSCNDALHWSILHDHVCIWHADALIVATQAAWILDDGSDVEDGEDGEEGDANMAKEDGHDEGGDEDEGGNSDWEDLGTTEDMEGKRRRSSSRATSTWGDTDEDPAAGMDEDEAMTAEQREEDWQRLKAAHRSDQEFPDEMDTPMDVPARQRFAKYRGLKSFRTSPWDAKEALPPEYARIFSFDNYKRTQKHVKAKMANQDTSSLVHRGRFVRLHIANFPAEAAESLAKSTMPVVVCGLLQHETKMSLLHFALRKAEAFTEPVKAKQPLLFHTGFQQYVARPIYSSDDPNVDKHKAERFLQPGRFCIASVYAPISFPPLPLLAFRTDGAGGLDLVATGSLRGVDANRVILKRIVLSAYPFSVSKRKAVVRYMFHNPEDVRWFKPLELWTKYGRRGRIKEPVGTKGSMKCIFDGVVQQRDAVCVSLYKRVFPRWPTED
eukprot:SM000013S26549  [mRNA]  locus=s13:989970:995494:+ [translate_table: standard]